MVGSFTAIDLVHLTCLDNVGRYSPVQWFQNESDNNTFHSLLNASTFGSLGTKLPSPLEELTRKCFGVSDSASD